MEKTGIGRPSTYAPTIKTLKQRDYIKLVKGKLHLTDLGRKTDDFVRQVFPDLVKADFTAQMEAQLDAIADGELEWQSYLTGWNRDYFEPALTAGCQLLGIDKPVSQQKSQRSYPQKPTNLTEFPCPVCGKPLGEVPYRKEGQDKVMLKCSVGTDKKHQEVVFFLTQKGEWWSKKWGSLRT